MKLIRSSLRSLIPSPLLRYRQLLALRRIAAQKGLGLVQRDLFFDLTRGNTVLRISRDHKAYLEHMIENFDYYVNSVLPLHVHKAQLVDMSGPRYHKLRGFADIPFLFPSHTEPYGTTADYLDFAQLKKGQTVLDIGAYAGLTSIIFAQLVGPTGRVYAFEADESNYECAQVNIEMASRVMNLNNITLLRKAVWCQSGELCFSNEGAMGSSAVDVTGRNRGNEQMVRSTSLEDFFRENGLTRADFVKIDIEGCEVKVLESSAGFLKGTGAKLIVEPHFVDGVMSTERCSRLLESAGFEVRVRGKVGESEPLIEATPRRA